MPNCSVCQKRSYNAYCVAHKPRKPIPRSQENGLKQRKPLPRAKKAIKQRGKGYDQWQVAKANWFKKNYKQHYTCHYCGTLLTNHTITLDHKIPRSRAPHMRVDITNLVPACFTCNGLKGSVAHDDYPHECH